MKKIILLFIMLISLVGCSKNDSKITTTKYVVTFNDGTKITTKEVIENELVTPITDPTKEGYEFIEWLLDGVKYTFETPVTFDVTLHANWRKINTESFTITFNSNGGSVVSNQTIEHGYHAIKPNNPTREDYDFIGWFIYNHEYDFDLEITSNLSLTAKWELKNDISLLDDLLNDLATSNLLLNELETEIQYYYNYDNNEHKINYYFGKNETYLTYNYHYLTPVNVTTTRLYQNGSGYDVLLYDKYSNQNYNYYYYEEYLELDPILNNFVFNNNKYLIKKTNDGYIIKSYLKDFKFETFSNFENPNTNGYMSMDVTNLELNDIVEIKISLTDKVKIDFKIKNNIIKYEYKELTSALPNSNGKVSMQKGESSMDKAIFVHTSDYSYYDMRSFMSGLDEGFYLFHLDKGYYKIETFVDDVFFYDLNYEELDIPINWYYDFKFQGFIEIKEDLTFYVKLSSTRNWQQSQFDLEFETYPLYEEKEPIEFDGNDIIIDDVRAGMFDPVIIDFSNYRDGDLFIIEGDFSTKITNENMNQSHISNGDLRFTYLIKQPSDLPYIVELSSDTLVNVVVSEIIITNEIENDIDNPYNITLEDSPIFEELSFYKQNYFTLEVTKKGYYKVIATDINTNRNHYATINNKNNDEPLLLDVGIHQVKLYMSEVSKYTIKYEAYFSIEDDLTFGDIKEYQIFKGNTLTLNVSLSEPTSFNLNISAPENTYYEIKFISSNGEFVYNDKLFSNFNLRTGEYQLVITNYISLLNLEILATLLDVEANVYSFEYLEIGPDKLQQTLTLENNIFGYFVKLVNLEYPNSNYYLLGDASVYEAQYGSELEMSGSGYKYYYSYQYLYIIPGQNNQLQFNFSQ